jgi:hypothetical protein
MSAKLFSKSSDDLNFENLSLQKFEEKLKKMQILYD